MVLASGDDILCFTDKPVHQWDLSFIGKAGSGLGLGQNPTDFVFGDISI